VPTIFTNIRDKDKQFLKREEANLRSDYYYKKNVEQFFKAAGHTAPLLTTTTDYGWRLPASAIPKDPRILINIPDHLLSSTKRWEKRNLQPKPLSPIKKIRLKLIITKRYKMVNSSIRRKFRGYSFARRWS